MSLTGFRKTNRYESIEVEYFDKEFKKQKGKSKTGKLIGKLLKPFAFHCLTAVENCGSSLKDGKCTEIGKTIIAPSFMFLKQNTLTEFAIYIAK